MINEAIHQLNEDGFIISERSENDQGEIHYIFTTRIEEEDLANRISRLSQQKLEIDKQRIHNWLDIYCERAHIKLSDQQKQAVIESASNRVFIRQADLESEKQQLPIPSFDVKCYASFG